MTLPETVRVCDAMELAAIAIGKPLFAADFAKQLFPTQQFAEIESDLKEAFQLSLRRRAAVSSTYPFDVTDRSLSFQTARFTGSSVDFNVYVFLLLGRALEFGGPSNTSKLQEKFRRYFEDVVSWSLKRAGFLSEVLSKPRRYRGLPTQLKPALREISKRFKESAILKEDRVLPSDNDLDTDVVAVPIIGNETVGGWPFISLQCATGKIEDLQSKLEEGKNTFTTVWEGSGFRRANQIRAVATPDDLLLLHNTHWLRLGECGWVLDRTRLSHLAGTKSQNVTLVPEAEAFWNELWVSRAQISWQSGWQQN